MGCRPSSDRDEEDSIYLVLQHLCGDARETHMRLSKLGVNTMMSVFGERVSIFFTNGVRMTIASGGCNIYPVVNDQDLFSILEFLSAADSVTCFSTLSHLKRYPEVGISREVHDDHSIVTITFISGEIQVRYPKVKRRSGTRKMGSLYPRKWR